jgi:hypothetical protein
VKCAHGDLKYIGEQRDDEGVNSYFECRLCGALVVTTPNRQVFAVEGAGRPK